MWQRFNISSHVFEKSDDDGATWTQLPMNASQISEGVINPARLPPYPVVPSNIAYTNVGNTFTQAQKLSMISPELLLMDTSAPADARIFGISNSSQFLIFRTLNDASTTQQSSPLALNRSGDAYIGRNIFEKGRGTPVGHWTVGDAGSYSQLGMTGPFAWSLIGKTLFLVMSARSVIPASALSRFNMPGGFVSAMSILTPAIVYSVASGILYETGLFAMNPGGNYFDIYREHQVAYPAGDTLINFSVSLPIQ